MRLAIYGAGDFGREVQWLLSSIHDHQLLVKEPFTVVGFLDDHPTRSTLGGLPVLTPDNAGPVDAVALAVGSSCSRRQAAARVLAHDWKLYTAVSPDILVDDSVSIGVGSLLCRGVIPTVDIAIGVGCLINLHCTIGHNAVLGDFVTLAPGVHISGRVTIEDDVSIGTGAVVINGTSTRPLTIGQGAVIGANACIIRDVPAGAVVGGVPARNLHR